MIKVYVMSTCSHCAAIKPVIMNDPRFEIIDIGAHVHNLKEFIQLRDNNPSFNDIKKKGKVGIPCFVSEDGKVSFSIEGLPQPETQQGESCSLDGKGC